MSQENVELVLGRYASWQEGDFSKTDWAADDIEFWPMEVWPDAANGRGIEHMRSTWPAFPTEWKDVRTSAEETIAGRRARRCPQPLSRPWERERCVDGVDGRFGLSSRIRDGKVRAAGALRPHERSPGSRGAVGVAWPRHSRTPSRIAVTVDRPVPLFAQSGTQRPTAP